MTGSLAPTAKRVTAAAMPPSALETTAATMPARSRDGMLLSWRAPASGSITLRIYGVDFTCAPRRAKPITAAAALLKGNSLRLGKIERLQTFAEFEQLL